jgi:hypothetical protein
MQKMQGDGVNYDLLEELKKLSEMPAVEAPVSMEASPLPAALPDPQPTSPVPEASPQPSPAVDRQQQLRDAMAASRDMDQYAIGLNLAMQGLAPIGQSADTSTVKMLQGRAQLPVQELERLRKGETEDLSLSKMQRDDAMQAKRIDPQSEESKAERTLMKQIFKEAGREAPAYLDSMSADQIDKNSNLKLLKDMFVSQARLKAQEQSQERMFMSREDREAKRQDAETQKVLERLTEKGRQAIKKDADRLTTVKESMDRIQMALDSPGGVVEYSAVVPFIKSLDDSVVREGEFRNFMNSTGLLNKWEGMSKKLFKQQGGLVSKEVLKQMADILNQTVKGGLSNMEAKITPIRNEAIDRGLNADVFTKRTLPNFQPLRLESGKETQPGKKVTKKQYSPSQNKTYITYEDGQMEVRDGRQ